MKGLQLIHVSKRFDNAFRHHQPEKISQEQNKKNRKFLLLPTVETRGHNWRLGEVRHFLRDYAKHTHVGTRMIWRTKQRGRAERPTRQLEYEQLTLPSESTGDTMDQRGEDAPGRIT